MSESFSHCTVLGTLRHPVEVTTTPTGSRVGHFELVLREQTSTGQWFSVVVGCQLWGKSLDCASRLQPGQPCLFQGKLARRKRGETWELCVSGFSLEPFATAAPVPPAGAPVSASRN